MNDRHTVNKHQINRALLNPFFASTNCPNEPRWSGVQASNLQPISVGVVQFHLSGDEQTLRCVHGSHRTSDGKSPSFLQVLFAVNIRLSFAYVMNKLYVHKMQSSHECCNYGRPMKQGISLYFYPVFSFYLLLSSFFPGLISAAAHWSSTILPHMVWPQCEFRMHV